MHNFHILVGSAKETAKRWRKQYEGRTSKLANERCAAEILHKLDALETPTKQSVNAIIGDNSWTDIWCMSCHEHKPKVVSFGADETIEVCEPCLRAALLKLTKTKAEK